jgi:O-antigen/teichoic acid export membrane protein
MSLFSTKSSELPHSGKESTAIRYAPYFQNEHLLKDLHGRSFRGGVVTLGGQAVKFLLHTASTVALARLLTPQDFGLIAMVSAIIGLIGLWTDLGLSNATVQRSEITHAQVSVLFWINCGLGTGVMLVVALLAPAVASFYHEPRLVGITVAVSTVFFLGGLTVQHRALLRRQMRFTLITIIDSVSMAVGIATGITMAWLQFGYWSLVGVQISSSFCNCALVWATCDWRPAAFERRVGARPMVAFGANVIGFQFLNYVTRNFDNILIGRVLGAAALGIYSKAYGLLMLPLFQINWPLAAVLLPALSRLQDRPPEYARLFLRATRAIALVTVPIVVFSFSLAEDIVLVLLGRQWLAAAPVFQLLAPAAAASAIAFVPNWLCQSLGRPQRQFHYALVSAPVCVTGFLIGIKWGVPGVAVSFSLTFTILFSVFVAYAAYGSPVKYSEIALSFWSAFWPACLAGFAAWMLRRAVLPDARPGIAFGTCAVVFGIFYVGTIMSSRVSRPTVVAGLSALSKSLYRPRVFSANQ